MVLTNKFKIAFKVISALMAGIFLWNQVAWAGDLISTVLENQYQEQSQTFAPAYLQNQQSAAESLVSQKQAIEDAINTQNLMTSADTRPPPDETIDLKGPRGGSGGQATTNNTAMQTLSQESTASYQDGAVLSVTTQAEDVIHYKDSLIDSIEKKDGTILRNLILDEYDNLLGAEITYPDGTIQAVANGKVFQVIKPDGTILNYNEEELIFSIIYPDGQTAGCSYTKDGQGNIIETILTDSEKTSTYYGSDNKLKKVEFTAGEYNGKIIEYNNGMLSEVKDVDGKVYTFEATGNTQSGDTEYVVKLKTIVDNSGVTYKIDENNIKTIEFPDKRITDFELDNQGKLVKGAIQYADGSIIIVENSKIKERRDLSSGYLTINRYEEYSGTYPENQTILANLDDDPTADTIIDFCQPFGVWIKYNDTTWQKLSDMDPKSMVAADIDGNGKADVIINFGSKDGVWIYHDSGTWTQLHNVSPESIVTADLDGNGKADIIIDFGTEYGIWIYHDNGTWAELHNVSPESIVTADLDGNGKDDIIIDFGAEYGIWIYHDSGTWTQLHNVSPESMVAGDLDGDGKKDIIIDFGPQYGIWIYRNDGSWQQLHYLSAKSMVTADLDGNGKSDAIIDFGPQYGIWIYYNNSEWQQLHNLSSKSVSATHYGDGSPDSLVIDFGAPHGVWEYNNNHDWEKLHDLSPGSMAPQTDQSGNTVLYIYNDPNTSPDFDLSLTLPGDMFDLTGHLKPGYDFKNTPYFNTIKYDKNGILKSVIDPGGDVASFKDGLVERVLGGSNQDVTAYSYDLTSSNNISRFTIERDGIKRIYDEYGNLSKISAYGVSTFFNNGAILRVEKEDGTIIEDAVFDANSNIVSAKITSPEGVRATYGGGVLIEAEQPDGSIFYYDSQGNITKLVNSGGVTYIYSTMVEGGHTYTIANAERQDLIQEPEEIVYQKFDLNKKLIQARRKNGDVINYSYENGMILASDGKTITAYDENNNIMRAEILPTAEDPVSTVSEYEYGRIRKVYKGSDLIYKYSYEFDPDGKESAVIEDLKTGDFKRYKDELLISVTDKNNIVTSYEYNSDKKISKSTAAYLGKVINTYIYTYDGDFTTIEDMDGIRRTYGKDDKLIFLEETGKTYKYTYTTDDSGNEISNQELIKVKDASGSVANYSNGIMRSIVKPDGTILGDFVFSSDGSILVYSILKDGVQYFIQNDKVIKEIRADGTIIEYNADGLVSIVSESTGKVTQYSYEYSGQGQVEYIGVTKDGFKYRYDTNGTFIEMIDSNNNHYCYDSSNKLIRVTDINKQVYDLSYDNDMIFIHSFHEIKQNIANEIANFSSINLVANVSNNNLGIRLDRNYVFDYGSGSDGDLRVEAGQTVVINGTKNYKSVYVAPGATLTVSPWNGISGGEILIKCQGSVIIEGIIEANAKGFIGGYEWSGDYTTIAKQGESYTGAQSYSIANNYGGGGGAISILDLSVLNCYGGYHGPLPIDYSGGGGGSYGTSGQNGYGYIFRNPQYSSAGLVYGDQFLNNFYKGSGGGAGVSGSAGGNGGGSIKIIASQINIKGSVSSNGGNGVSGSGGGSGGAIWLIGDNININSVVSAMGGCGSSWDGLMRGGDGGYGRIRIDYGTFTGNMPTPTPYMSQIPYDSQGVVTSNPIMTTATQLGNIMVNADVPTGTSAKFNTRTGASANDADGSWNEWIEATKDTAGYKINSPINKYIQYQAVFETTDVTQTPAILQTGDYAIKLDYSYDNAFDATAPPDDMLFKDYLIFTPPEFPISLDLASIKPDFTSIIKNPETIESRILPDETIIYAKSFKEGPDNISVDTTKDNKITYYVNGKVRATYQKHEDNHLELLIEYSYDNDGNLMSVNMPSARNSLDAQIATARQQIAAERASYLRTLVQQKGLAYTQIRDEVQAIRDQITAARPQLQSQLYQEVTRSRWVGWWIFGWYETYTETVEVPGVRDAINQLNEQDRQLNIQEADAYAQLDAQVSAAKQTLNQDEDAALTEVTNQETQFQGQIIKEESTPVILEYYRSILGRDPDEVETQSWLNTAAYNSKIDVNILKNTLLNLQEYSEQSAFVAALKSRISDTLYNYAGYDEAGKESFLGTLGLSAADAVRLGTKDVDAILTLLDKQNIHFGRSAFVALETILTNNGITFNLEDLALKTILIDIFTGSLKPLSENKLLELSMYSLSTAASTYGVTLDNTRLNYDELTQAFNSSGQIIAHLRNNHYVVITNIIADGKISYVERNRGRDGYTWTASREEFEFGWTGYAIVQKTSAKGTLPDTVLAKTISAEAAQRVKGSCLEWLFLAIVWICGGIATAATAAVTAISAIVAGISAIIGPIISGIGALISGVANFMIGIGTTVFNAISFVGTSLLPVLGQAGSWLGGIGSFLGNALGLGGIISSTGFNLTGLGLALGKTIVTTALSVGISKGLELLGVNSTISGLISAFVTGGVSGLFNNGFSVLSFITGGIQGLAIQGVNELAPRLGIDPMLSNVISMTAGAFIGAIGNSISPDTGLFDLGGFSASIGKEILPNITSEFAYYGITKAGELLGVDPRISYLAGVGIRSSISTGLGDDGVFDWQDAWGGIQQGLLQGVTNIGLNFATEELGISPLLANIGFSAISGAINAGIQAATGGSKDVFGALFKTYKDNALTFLGSGESSNAWQQAAYISQILDFSNIVQERGLVDALNSYGAGFFNAVAVNSIVQSGMSIGQYFATKLAAGQYTTRTLQDGTVVKEVAVTDGQNTIANAFFQQKQVGEDTYWDLIGGEEFKGGDSYLTWGDFGVDPYGKLGYTDAELYSIFDSDIQYQRIIGGQQAYAEIKDSQGNTLLIVEPTAGGHYNVYNSLGEYESARVLSTITDIKLDITNGTPNNVTIGQGTGAISINMSGQDFSSLLFSAVENGKIVMDKLIKQTTWLGLVGIAEAAENITSPLTGVANIAIDRINSGQSIDLASLASTSTWQSIFATSGSMSDWANTATLLFTDSISPMLAPGTEMLMSLFGSESFREQLNSKAAETFNGYNLFEELASAALGNPGSGTIVEQIGAKSFWEGVKSTAELVWNNRDTIFSNIQDLANLTLNPVGYLTDQFWASDIGQEFIRERDDFFCLTPRDTRRDYDGVTNTAFVDQDLSYADIFNQPVSGILDLLTLVRIGNVRWDSANIDAAPYYDAYVRQGVKGISISGINDDGAKLDRLTKLLVQNSPCSFTMTHSSGRGVLSKSTVVTNKAMSISPQEDRRDVEAWIDTMGLTKDQMLIVDTAGDLPYRPIDLVDLSLQDILNPANITNPANLLTTNVQNLVNNNAYHDYSSNPAKYTYVRLESGPGIGINPVANHTVGIDGAFDSNGNLSMDKKYRYSVDGVMSEEELTIGEIYTRFLKGEL